MLDHDSTRGRGKARKSDGPRKKLNPIHLILFPKFEETGAVSVLYTNHRGETRLRSIRPVNLYWGSNQWHPEPQWLVDGIDTEIDQLRTFALKGMQPI